MKIVLETGVQAPLDKVISGFDENLFRYLSPRFPRTKILRHDAIEPGGKLELVLHYGPYRQYWFGEFIAVHRSEGRYWFADRGDTLPFPFRYWQHKHVLLADGPDRTIIRDEIEFRTGWKFLDLMTFPLLKSVFAARKPRYVAYFKQ